MTVEDVDEAIRRVRGNNTIRVWTGQENLHISSDDRDIVSRFRVDYPDRSRRGRYIDSMSLLMLLSNHEFTVVSDR